MVRAVVLLVLLALVCLDSCLFVFSKRNAHHNATPANAKTRKTEHRRCAKRMKPKARNKIKDLVRYGRVSNSSPGLYRTCSSI